MLCITPITLRQKDGFNTVPCGKCYACLNTKRQQWAFRLSYELKQTNFYAVFLTLTYNDENIPLDENGQFCFNKKQVQNYIKQIRHLQKSKISHYLISEYGGKTYRPHYHTIMYGIESQQIIEKIQKTWQYGFTYVGTVTPASVNYVCKFHVNSKGDIPDGIMKPFSIMSKKIGASYIPKYKEWHKTSRPQDRYYVAQEGGYKTPLPRYFKDKMYNKHEKALIRKHYEATDPHEAEKIRLWKEKNPTKNYYSYINEVHEFKTKTLNKRSKDTL